MAVQVPVTNPSRLSTLKVTLHDAVVDEKTQKVIPNKYKKGTSFFIHPGKTENVWLEAGKRGVFLEEIPA